MPVKKRPIVIHADHLSYVRGQEEIIHHFSFEIAAGDYVGIIGPNGGGKSTLVRLILGLLTPTAGSLQVLGGSPQDRRVRARVGYVAQRGGNMPQSFPSTVEEVVRAGRSPRLGLFGFFSKNDEDAVKTAADRMGITHLLSRPVSHLSGGERQKMLLARALAAEPEILLLDEPIDGLDPLSREDLYAHLRRLNKQGMTILTVSHDVHALAQDARSAICLKHQLVCHGEHACVIDQEELQNMFHKNRKDLLSHHH